MVKMRMDEYGIWIHARKPRVEKKMRAMKPKEAAAKERRDVVRRAYFMIRDDKSRHETVTQFARALGGKIDLTDEMLSLADQIILDHQGCVLQ